MKKIALLILMITSLNGAPVGNTAAPKILQKGFFTSSESWVDIRLGYEGDFVADGRLEQCNERVDCFKQITNSGTLTLNILDRIDVYGVLGATKPTADWRVVLRTDGTVHRIQLETNNALLWAIGGRAILSEWGNASLGFGGRYSASSPSPAHLSLDGKGESIADTHFEWSEWQFNFDMSCKIKLFTPYIGVKYSNTTAHLHGFSIPIAANGTGINSLRNRDPVGLYLGCALSNGNYFMLNLEWRLIDEESATVSADFRF